MNQQSSTPPDYQRKSNQVISKAERSANEFNASVAALRTEADRARGLFGIGRRIIVPPDEIHVVVGDGKHSFLISSERKIFGQTADRPSRYWLNGLTQVIKLKTISFTVPLRGVSDEGIEALDRSKVSFRLWAHAVAKLNPDKAEIAAQRVGLDTTGLVSTITQVGTAELIAAAATMDLENTIAERQRLAEIAFPKVNQILSELGYDLALLTITRLEGMAYQKLVEQAESRISKETSIATNQEQVAELQNNQSRARTEAEIQAETEKKLANERLEAQREVETATLGQQEALAVRRHEVEVKRIERDKLEAEVSHQTDLAKVQLNQKLGEAETEKEARLARIKAERDAELRALQQERQAAIRMIETKAEAERMALEQIRKIERAAEQTQAEAKRLREEELAAAERGKDIALVEAGQLAEALKVEAEAQARALQLKVDAETKAELTRAEAEANATEKRAKAAKVRADATRAESAASGLAEAEVEAARVQVSEKRVAVTRSEGLALAEVARAQAEADAERLLRIKDVEISAQQRQVELYSQAPVLVDLEKMRMQFEHEERIASLRMETSLKAIQAIAPGVKVRVFGSGGQSGQFINEILSFTQGLNIVGEDAPFINKMLQGSTVNSGYEGLGLAKFLPYIQQIMAETNPRIFSSLKLGDLVDRLGPVVAGEQDLADGLRKLKKDANFRVVGDVPIGPLMSLFGIKFQKDLTIDSDDGLKDEMGDAEDNAKKHPDMPA